MDDEAREGYFNTWKAMKPSHITIYIKGKYADALPHPVPRGGYQGTLVETPRWALFTFQAVTLSVAHPQEEKSPIITLAEDAHVSKGGIILP
jgi:hypothetical protein